MAADRSRTVAAAPQSAAAACRGGDGGTAGGVRHDTPDAAGGRRRDPLPRKAEVGNEDSREAAVHAGGAGRSKDRGGTEVAVPGSIRRRFPWARGDTTGSRASEVRHRLPPSIPPLLFLRFRHHSRAEVGHGRRKSIPGKVASLADTAAPDTRTRRRGCQSSPAPPGRASPRGSVQSRHHHHRTVAPVGLGGAGCCTEEVRRTPGERRARQGRVVAGEVPSRVAAEGVPHRATVPQA